MSNQPVTLNLEILVEFESISEETWQQWFQTWINSLNKQAEAGYELSLRLTDDAEITQLNAQYRNQNRATDVLAFAALEVDIPKSSESETEPIYLGDVVISVETARIQAQTKGHSLVLELAWLASHGLLHLLGWDHPDEKSLDSMLTQQEQLLRLVELDWEYLQ
ncbi:rRNA maturation RNase YbeY [Gloeocapsa sp. PCC 73106]|uniref:rRNA maturation RNase YbeY n=1 Tax=Gloeocapsa sp. PCC 73106 TaxID=102232 RepID=UPI0002ABAB60|nr:rRNA maturation RNase YbeY [Gloeocapsa sp. PCC 73106]ELR96827.1 metalloprotein, YbeY/UPF0054 family [Gloeocapsa sp. PCC 73106]